LPHHSIPERTRIDSRQRRHPAGVNGSTRASTGFFRIQSPIHLSGWILDHRVYKLKPETRDPVPSRRSSRAFPSPETLSQVTLREILVYNMVAVGTYIPDLGAPPEISFENRIPSDHRGILTQIELRDGHNLSREYPVVRLKMKPINKALTELVRQKGDLHYRNSPTSFGPMFKGVRNTAALRPRTTSIDAGASGSSPARA